MEQVKKTLWKRFGAFTRECWRVLRVTKRPDWLEFKTIVQVAGLGMLIIGAIGFILQMIKIVFFVKGGI
ncbi:protein translocase SEC61 complex subunit gamma [Candidatus Woesearchaeota archaeon]|nr:MAG: protein translocase SEC61 complex subunit gamma [Candidatus Woesearchaeota archaeon]